MKLKNIQLNRATQHWIKRRDIKPQMKLGLHSEPRDWMQHAIMEAEKSTDFKKKDQFPSLPEELNHTEEQEGL